MAAKLLHSLTDDNADLRKQIGCMTGIFQLFDRHHILTGKRVNHRRLLTGNSYLNNGSLETSSTNVGYQHTTTEKDSNKNMHEKQRLSTESSRVSFSSSSCSSSMSSLECNKTVQPEPSSFDRIIFPETHSRDPAMSQPSAPPQVGRQSLDLRDLVKDSMYREARGLSVKTATKKEAVGHAMKHRDSPRPEQPSKSMDGSYGDSINRKQNMPVNLKESLRVLAKLREAPWYFNEARELPRSSYEAKDGSFVSIPKDAPRFSYDGRDINGLSFESRDTFKSTSKLKELPRLSLDSRGGSVRGSNSDSRSNSILRNFQKDGGNCKDNASNAQQITVSQKRPTSVVAKLMGLEALPASTSAHDSQMGLIKTFPIEDCDPFSRSPKTPDLSRPVRMSYSPRSSWKEPTSPRWRNPDAVMKPVSSSRFPIEAAPWRQQDGSRSSPKPASRTIKVPAREPNSFPSFYSEIEKRLKDLEFKQSGKDLRALKQILDAMQVKGLLETRNEEQTSNFTTQKEELKYTSFNQKVRVANQQKPQSNRSCAATVEGANSRRNFESPIVIMKPAKLIEKSGFPASSVISVDDFSSFNQPRGSNFADNRKDSINSKTAKVLTAKNGTRDHVVSTIDKRNNVRNSRSAQTPPRPQQLPKENTSNTIKSSGSVSPRLQQKKLELEKRSRPSTPSSDLSKTRRQSHKQPTESTSPGGKRRPKSPNLQQRDGQLSEISSESRNLSYQGDDISVQSDSNMEVTSAERSTEIDGSWSPSMKAAKCPNSGSMKKQSTLRLTEDGSLVELATIAPEHPSPVSVLDTLMYRDDAPSPVKQTPTALKDNGNQNSSDSHDKEQWKLKDDDLLSNGAGPGLPSEINRKKLQHIEHLVQKLKQLNSTHDESSTDYIASLCENTKPDHRYISEILLASGLLLRDLDSSVTTFQLHPSGHPINPELFFVLEQTKGSTLLPEECSSGTVSNRKPEQGKYHRKLIFDAVNEILAGKLSLAGACAEPWIKPDKLARKTLSAQKLLKELCLEIEQLQAYKTECITEDKEDDFKTILWKDVMHGSESWTDFRGEISGLALDVERLIFKDLVDEIVMGESTCLRVRPGRRCRQLFAK